MIRWLSDNLALKLIALAASIVIWYYATSTERNPNQFSKQVNAEVRVVGAPPADIIVKVIDHTVPVEISGPRSDVEPINDSDVKALVNLQNARPDSQRLPILDPHLPAVIPGVTIRALRQTVAVDVQRRVKRHMAIEKPVFQNEAPLGQTYGPFRLDPDWADVSGTRDDVQRVAKLRVYIPNRGGSVREDVQVHPEDKQGVDVTGVTVDPPTTHVEMNLVEAPGTRALVVSVPTRGQVATGYEVEAITVDPVQVTVVGRTDVLLQLTNVSTAPVVLDGLSANVVRTVPLDLPAGVTLHNGRTEVRVSIAVRPIQRSAP